MRITIDSPYSPEEISYLYDCACERLSEMYPSAIIDGCDEFTLDVRIGDDIVDSYDLGWDELIGYCIISRNNKKEYSI